MGCSSSSLGKLPPDGLQLIENDISMATIEESMWVTVVRRNFRSQGQYSNYKRSVMPHGSLAVTDSRLVVYLMRKRLINIPFDDERISEIEFLVNDGNTKTLTITLDASLFQATESGTLEYKFCTDQAKLIYSKIENGIRKANFEKQQSPKSDFIPEAQVVAFY